MTFAAAVSQALSGIDHSNNAGNKYDLLVDIFAAELRVGSSEVIAKSIGAQAGNALPRLGEAANSTSTGFVLGVCNFGTEDEYAKSALQVQAELKVGQNRFEAVLYLREDPASKNDWIVFMVVAKQYSPVLELIASEWPQCTVIEIPTTCSLRNEIQQILELQPSYTHVAASPQMRARGAALVKSRDQLNWELRTLNKPTTWKSECSNGQGNAAKSPWVRLADFDHSPKGSEGFFLVFLFSEDGSKAYLSLNQGTTVQSGGGATLLDQGELRAKSSVVRDKYVYGLDHSPLPELKLHGTPTASIDLGNFDLSMQYAAGNVIAYEYALDQVPSHHSIVCQITALIPVLEKIYKGEPQVVSDPSVTDSELDELVRQTYWSKTELTEVLASLRDKSPQIILEGPPGTGKTHVAKRIAHHLVGATYGEDSSDVTIVQFHPSYGYEEFVEGLRPDVSEGGLITFANQPGPILKIADKIVAEGRPHVLIIDELNRANIPRVFGELMYLLEYRDESIDLMLRPNFVLPKDLYIIATMNTADKSIRLMDAALRRRFDFFSVLPGEDILRSFYDNGENQNMIGEDLFVGFAALNAALKAEIGDDGYLIGHSFFMTYRMDKEFLASRWKRQIGPLINEYFYDRQAPQQEFTLERFWAI
jgi:hypothetical protein